MICFFRKAHGPQVEDERDGMALRAESLAADLARAEAALRRAQERSGLAAPRNPLATGTPSEAGDTWLEAMFNTLPVT